MKGIGLLKIPGGMLCKKDALGQQFHGKISGINVTLAFPSISNSLGKAGLGHIGMENPLIAPINRMGLPLDGENIIWGYPMKAPEMHAFVEHVLVELECDETEFNEVVQNVYAGVQEWTCSFKRFLQLRTKQQIERKPKVVNPGKNLQLFFEGKYVDNQQPQVLHVHFNSDSAYASSEEIQRAMDFASSGKDLFLEYQMLLSAYDARKDGENRQAIIDACSAVEICLLNWLNCYCKQKGFAPEILTEKYRSLGERFKLVKKLDNSLPSFDFGNAIVKPRNDVAHNRDVYPTNECTNQLISMVEMYLAHYHTSYY